MINRLDNIIVLNGTITLDVIEGVIVVKMNQQSYTLPYEGREELLAITSLLGEFEGEVKTHISSDIYDINNETIGLKPLKLQVIYEVVMKVIESTIPFLAKRAEEAGVPIIIRVFMEVAEQSFGITANLEDDLPVILLAVKQNNSEGGEICWINAFLSEG